jgi:enamine deaminase RidA (YjgF/YER057c/UK114 family)
VSKEVFYAGTEFEKIYPPCKAVRTGNTLLIAGTGGVDYETGLWPESAAVQAGLAIENIRAVLAKFGVNLAEVVRCKLIYTNKEAWSAAMQ